jgi:hypothetical protein
MGIYINAKCQKCGFSFSDGYKRSALNSKLGLPFIKCPNCNTVSKTGNQIYSLMNSWEKRKYFFIQILQTLINGIAISLILFMLSFFLKFINESTTDKEGYVILIICLIVGFIVSVIISYFYNKITIAKLEKAYKNKDERYFADV